MSARYFYHRVTLSPLFHTVLLGRKSLCTSCTSGVGSYAPSPLGKSIYIKYLGLFHMGYLSILSIHLFIQSFVSVDIHEYLSYTLAQSYFVYFLAHIVCSWTSITTVNKTTVQLETCDTWKLWRVNTQKVFIEHLLCTPIRWLFFLADNNGIDHQVFCLLFFV